jgi:exopolyphosphatase/guanosine-5'-triphosphate,3'-diphosphate pyrophosphatase
VHENRRLHPEALERARETFQHFSEIIARHSVDRVLACATSAARDVTNADELIAIAGRYEIPIQIISGNQEAELTFAGTIPDDLVGTILIIDVGGGSTECILGDRNGIKARKSIDVGAVRLTEACVTAHPISDGEMTKMANYIEERLREAARSVPPDPDAKIIAVAGTPTTLAAVDQCRPFDYQKVHGYRLTREAIQNWIQRFKAMTVAERQALSGMDPKRADVIVAGSLILNLSLASYGQCEMEVSVRGLRYGIARAMEQNNL